MPIYEYRCEKCGVFEETQRITDPPLDRCPTCRRKVRRLISSTSFQLKGGGWYVTDYARGGKSGDKKSADKDGGEAADKAADKSSKADSGTASSKDGGSAAGSPATKPESKSAAADA